MNITHKTTERIKLYPINRDKNKRKSLKLYYFYYQIQIHILWNLQKQKEKKKHKRAPFDWDNQHWELDQRAELYQHWAEHRADWDRYRLVWISPISSSKGTYKPSWSPIARTKSPQTSRNSTETFLHFNFTSEPENS